MRYASLGKARGVAILMVLLIGVPSALLTALGVVAIRNEEEAAVKRLESVYQPVGMDLARGFNDKLDSLLHDADSALADLAQWKGQLPHPALSKLEALRQEALLTNFFVIDISGEVLFPVDAQGAGGPRLPTVLTKAMDADLDHSGLIQRCDNLTKVEVPPEATCLRDLALAFCPGGPDFDTWSASCPALADYPAVRAGFTLAAATRAAAAVSNVQGPARALERELYDPLRPMPFALAELLARAAVSRLAGTGEMLLPPPTEELFPIVFRAGLLEHIPTVAASIGPRAALLPVRVDGWRRLVVVRRVGDLLVGGELISLGFDNELQRLVGERGLEGIMSYILPMESPPCCHESVRKAHQQEGKVGPIIAAWFLLKHTELTWRLVVEVKEDGALGMLRTSRSTIYLWGLVLGITALIGGIVFLVRAVLREARFSRLRSDFVSSVSHDLRTPLTSIRMFTETLLMGRTTSREEERGCLEVIARETERLTRLTERILDFSRMEAGRKAYDFAPVSVSEVIDQALAACRPLLDEAGFTVEKDTPADLPQVEMDRDAMVEVLINLISNAIKYSPDERLVRISARQSGDEIEISVSDRGMGIPKREHERIFEQFYRVDCRRASEVGGSGIGLSLVRYILSAHRGTVAVESAPGIGSTFTVRVPLMHGVS